MTQRQARRTVCLLALLSTTLFLGPTLGAEAAVPSAEKTPTIPAVGHPTLIEIGSHWCVPCRAMKPVMEKLSREYDEAGLAKVYVINIEDDFSVVARFNPAATPTFIVFDRSGQERARVKGAVDESVLHAMLKPLL